MRETASTDMNRTSSRSHAVFSIIVEHSVIENEGRIMLATKALLTDNATGEAPTVTIGKLNMVDLAGSERVKTTGITAGKRLEEMKKINTSLTAFGFILLYQRHLQVDSCSTGKVILALTSPGNQHVPYRDSKLTRILQGSLGGNCKTTMIAAVSPSSLVSTVQLHFRLATHILLF